MQTASVADILHMEHVLCVILEDLSAADLLSLAGASTACRAAVQPRSLEVSVCSCKDLRVLQNLKSLGCLQNLQQVKSQVDEGNYMFKATLQVLATCPALKRLNVKLAFCEDAQQWLSDLLLCDLLHVDRTIAVSGDPSFEDSLHCPEAKWHHVFQCPARSPLLFADIQPCLKAIYRVYITRAVLYVLRKRRMI